MCIDKIKVFCNSTILQLLRKPKPYHSKLAEKSKKPSSWSQLRSWSLGCLGALIVTTSQAGYIPVTPYQFQVFHTASIDLTPFALAQPQNQVDANNFADNFPNAAGHPFASPLSVLLSFPGINAGTDRRSLDYLGEGNTRNSIPSDMAVCVGSGYVLQSVNSSFQISNTLGQNLTPVINTNVIADVPPTVLNGPIPFGTSYFDPVCHYDPDTQRFFHLTIVFDRYGNPNLGSLAPHYSAIYLSVSHPRDPFHWEVFKIPADNNGADLQGPSGPTPDGIADTANLPCQTATCFFDYNKINVDKDVVVIGAGPTANKIRDPSHAILLISKNKLISAQSGFLGKYIDGREISGNGLNNLLPLPLAQERLFISWPAITQNGVFDDSNQGTTYLVQGESGGSSKASLSSSDLLYVIAVSNTQAIDTDIHALKVSAKAMTNLLPYLNNIRIPMEQKPGLTPLRECMNDRGKLKAAGLLPNPTYKRCNQYYSNITVNNSTNNNLLYLDTISIHVKTAVFAAGKLWVAVDTGIKSGNKLNAVLNYYILDPSMSPEGVSVDLVKQGIVSIPNMNLAFPSFAINQNGVGILGFDLIGPNFYPGHAYVPFDVNGAGNVVIAKEGKGPVDDWGYLAFGVFPEYPGTRWGDYTAAAVDPDTGDLWIATNSVEQSCTIEEFLSDVPPTLINLFRNPLFAGSCNNTRTSSENWGSRISKIKQQ